MDVDDEAGERFALGKRKRLDSTGAVNALLDLRGDGMALGEPVEKKSRVVAGSAPDPPSLAAGSSSIAESALASPVVSDPPASTVGAKKLSASPARMFSPPSCPANHASATLA
jgi:hypothetical protein